MSEEMKTVEQLQEEIAKLKQELADLKSSQAPAQEAEPVAAADQEIPGGESEMALQVLQTIEQLKSRRCAAGRRPAPVRLSSHRCWERWLSWRTKYISSAASPAFTTSN